MVDYIEYVGADDAAWQFWGPYEVTTNHRFYVWSDDSGEAVPVPVAPYACPMCGNRKSYSISQDKNGLVRGMCEDCGLSDDDVTYWENLDSRGPLATVYPCVNEGCSSDYTVHGNIYSELVWRSESQGRKFCGHCGDCLHGARMYSVEQSKEMVLWTPGAAHGRIRHMANKLQSVLSEGSLKAALESGAVEVVWPRDGWSPPPPGTWSWEGDV